jgi:parallel beta-helix repeat protein
LVTGNLFQNNSASSGPGGGLYSGDGGLPVIEGNEFIDNSAYSGGGGIACSRSPARIRENTFDNNQSTFLSPGGGVFVSASTDVEIVDNRFEGNGGNGGGGGIYTTRSSPLISSNEFIGNIAGIGGGAAIYCNESSSPEIRENLLISNTSSAAAGGIAVADSSNPQIISNTLVANSAALGGGGLYITLHSNPALTGNIIVGSPTGNGIEITADASVSVIACNDVWNNLPANYSGLADPTGVDGNISADPEFCDPELENYRLQPGSPCTAANAPVGCGRMGVLPEGCTVVSIEPGPLPAGVQLFQNIPNPVRQGTRIRFHLSQPEGVRLAVYNVAGRLIRVAYNRRQMPAGTHEWVWDGRDDRGYRATSGVYFYTLIAGGERRSEKLLFLE